MPTRSLRVSIGEHSDAGHTTLRQALRHVPGYLRSGLASVYHAANSLMSPGRMGTLARSLALCVAAAIASGCGPNRTSEYTIPSEAARQKNPFGVTSESVARGKELYAGAGCAICHGKDGDGEGVLAKDISMKLHNWRDRSVEASFSDGELFYIMQNGKGTSRGKMPSYRDQETPEEVWDTIS